MYERTKPAAPGDQPQIVLPTGIIEIRMRVPTGTAMVKPKYRAIVTGPASYRSAWPSSQAYFDRRMVHPRAVQENDLAAIASGAVKVWHSSRHIALGDNYKAVLVELGCFEFANRGQLDETPKLGDDIGWQVAIAGLAERLDRVGCHQRLYGPKAAADADRMARCYHPGATRDRRRRAAKVRGRRERGETGPARRRAGVLLRDGSSAVRPGVFQ